MKIVTKLINFKDSNTAFSYREDSIGDNGVIQQIFQNLDYEITHWYQGLKLLEYHHRKSQFAPSLIVDAGANIGASAVYFSETFSNSVVFAIEPDLMNWHLLEINTNGLNVFNFNGAISDVDGELFFKDPGRSDWGYMTQRLPDPDNSLDSIKVKSISPLSILTHPVCKNTNPLILKIDIEGAEETLFDGDTGWLGEFPLVIIELHDWMLPFSGSSRNFIKAVAGHDFDFLHKGENIFLFNRAILNF